MKDYYPILDAMVFVVDAVDKERFEEARERLQVNEITQVLVALFSHPFHAFLDDIRRYRASCLGANSW